MKKRSNIFAVALLSGLSAIVATTSYADSGASNDDTSDAKIALSNSYAGNSWRQEMLKTWKTVAKEARGQKLVGKTKIVNANNAASTQSNQIGNLVLQGWDAIVVDAASPTALNGIIKKACSAGIVVVTFDSLAQAPCAYKIEYDFVHMGELEADFLAKQMHKKGNVLEVRGIPGTSVDKQIHEGVVKGLKQYPDMKIVGSVHGNWTQTIAQKEVAGVLPTLPKIGGVATQGGDGLGTYQAFKSAGRPTPLIIMGNRGDELGLWHKLDQQSGGYKTLSIGAAPGIASIAFWEAQQILAGKDVPKTITVPLLQVNQDDLDVWRRATPKGSVATPVYGRSWTIKAIDAYAQGNKMPASPRPNSD